METLYSDILKIIISNLSIKDIFTLCKVNKRFRYIIDDRGLWEVLFKREIKGKMDIPSNADISGFKEKIKTYPNVKKIADLIRSCKVGSDFIEGYNGDWNSFELVENLKELLCDHHQLISLPPMPNLKRLYCSCNQLTFLPLMSNLRILYCCDNQLVSLPLLTNLKKLNCRNNQLTSLPLMPNLEELYCNDNKLITLPPILNLRTLHCVNNPFPFFTLKEWINYWISSS